MADFIANSELDSPLIQLGGPATTRSRNGKDAVTDWDSLSVNCKSATKSTRHTNTHYLSKSTLEKVARWKLNPVAPSAPKRWPYPFAPSSQGRFRCVGSHFGSMEQAKLPGLF
jgi:hypothetical protein